MGGSVFKFKVQTGFTLTVLLFLSPGCWDYHAQKKKAKKATRKSIAARELPCLHGSRAEAILAQHTYSTHWISGQSLR